MNGVVLLLLFTPESLVAIVEKSIHNLTLIVMERHLTDAELIARFLEEKKSCFLEVLFKRHLTAVRRYVDVHGDACAFSEDIVQETFLKFMTIVQSGKYQEQGVCRAFLLRIAHNLLYDYWRKQKREPQKVDLWQVELEEEESDFGKYGLCEESPEERFIDAEINRQLTECIRKLPDAQKEVVLMRAYGGMSVKDVALHTTTNFNTVSGRMRYARHTLATLLMHIEVSQMGSYRA